MSLTQRYVTVISGIEITLSQEMKTSLRLSFNMEQTIYINK